MAAKAIVIAFVMNNNAAPSAMSQLAKGVYVPAPPLEVPARPQSERFKHRNFYTTKLMSKPSVPLIAYRIIYYDQQ